MFGVDKDAIIRAENHSILCINNLNKVGGYAVFLRGVISSSGGYNMGSKGPKKVREQSKSRERSQKQGIR